MRRRQAPTLRWDLRAVSVLLVVVLLFKVGFVYEVIGDVPLSTSVSFARMSMSSNEMVKSSFYSDYVPLQDVRGAKWLSGLPDCMQVYADYLSSSKVLRAYGMRIVPEDHELSADSTIGSGYVYLPYMAVVGGILMDPNGNVFDSSAIHVTTSNWNKAYSNGGTEIYESALSQLC
jgi:uncharacterized membrane protein